MAANPDSLQRDSTTSDLKVENEKPRRAASFAANSLTLQGEDLDDFYDSSQPPPGTPPIHSTMDDSFSTYVDSNPDNIPEIPASPELEVSVSLNIEIKAKKETDEKEDEEVLASAELRPLTAEEEAQARAQEAEWLKEAQRKPAPNKTSTEIATATISTPTQVKPKYVPRMSIYDDERGRKSPIYDDDSPIHDKARVTHTQGEEFKMKKEHDKTSNVKPLQTQSQSKDKKFAKETSHDDDIDGHGKGWTPKFSAEKDTSSPAKPNSKRSSTQKQDLSLSMPKKKKQRTN